MDFLCGGVELCVELTLNLVVSVLQVFFFDGEEELVSSLGVWCLGGWGDGEDLCWDSL